MKKVGWGFLLMGVCLACNGPKSGEGEKSAGATGSVKGIVSYKEDKKTLPDARALVYIVSTTKPNPTATPGDKFKNQYFQASTDVDGVYAFNNLPADTYTLVFQSGNVPRKLSYYKSRYSEVVDPLISDMPLNNLSGKQAKKDRLNSLFQKQQVHVKPNLKLTGGGSQIVTQEFIKH